MTTGGKPIPVYMNATMSLRPTKRPSPSAAPSGTPMSVLKSSAMPETRSERETISSSAASPVKISRSASIRPCPVPLMGKLRDAYICIT